MLKIKVAIIDADLIGRKKHRFPNLACMKLSSYYKSIGADVELKLDYENLDTYDKVTISKVFMDTEIPFEPDDKSLKTEDTIDLFYKDNPILNLPNVEYGGTGFYYNRSPKLSVDIEHIMPDYHLYDEWVAQQIEKGVKPKDLTYYTDWSIGFTTRGCIRQCAFCVNKNYKKCELHSSLSEFVDESRPYICLLDDNVLACPKWREVFNELAKTGKRFQFKQGVDERLLTDEKCEVLFNCKWIGDRIFAFDNIKDKDLIINRLEMIRRHTKQVIKFYTFCAFNHDKRGFEGWTKEHEIKLLELLTQLHKQGTRFALSNNLKYDNPYLKEWLDNNDYCTIHYLKGDYVNCNYHKIDRSKDVEVLITNY